MSSTTMNSDSAASSPMALTPQSTGSPDVSAIKKQRRQTAFYPNTNSSNKPQNPFSRSAAKRESVLALGSIEHLQYYFTKTGIAAKKQNMDKPHWGLVPAIGGISHVETESSPNFTIPELQLPPSPPLPVSDKPDFASHVRRHETNPDSLLPGIVEDLTSVERAWKISAGRHHSDFLEPTSSPDKSINFDVLVNLKATTNAIRSVRNYVLSLPDESTDTIRAQFRPKSLPSSAPVPKRLVSQPNDPTDPLSLVRRSALEVLTVLRDLEESSRLPLEDEAYDAQSDHISSRVDSPTNISESLDSDIHRASTPNSFIHEPDTDAPVAFSVMKVQGRSEAVLVWGDEHDDTNFSDEEREKRERWDERLVVGSGWLYKQDIRFENLQKEKDVVERYLDVVDGVLFGGPRDGRRGWEKERERVAKKLRADKEVKASRRRVSAGDGDSLSMDGAGRSARRIFSSGMLDAMKNMSVTEEPAEMESEVLSEGDSIDDDELPDWAKRSCFTDDPLGRVHNLITSFLPAKLLPLLSSPSPRTAFLSSLSSGQLLCAAYNACVRKSNKPWGYVSKDAIHDIIALELANEEQRLEEDKEAKRGWTFRRTDNLRLWAGALKLRYLLPIVAPAKVRTSSGGASPPEPSPSSTSFRFPSTDPPIIFDAPLVARKETGWEDMLQHILMNWVEAVVDERRGER